MLKVAVLMGGTSAEREVSLVTGKAVHEACCAGGYQTSLLTLDHHPDDLIPALKSVDLVFNALHGGIGENGIIQGFLTSIGVPYTGSGALSSAICMDKQVSKTLVRSAGYLTPQWIARRAGEPGPAVDTFPVVVKPNDQGSTIGLTIVQEQAELAAAVALAGKYSDLVIIEHFIPGREITVAVLGDRALPIVEIFPSHGLYDYACKYEHGLSRYQCPADIPVEAGKRIQSEALELYRLLRCEHYARLDFRLDDTDTAWFLEANTLPGMTSTSLVPKAARAAGIEFNELIQRIIDQVRHG